MSKGSGFAHPRVERLDALTSLRFLAALYVLAFHYRTLFLGDASSAGFLSLGYSGVTFFFLLSGFILAYNYKSVEFSAGPAVRDYLLARVARIYPVFLVSLVVSLPFFIKAVLQSHAPHHDLLAAAATILTPLGLHAWVPGAACALNCPSWSISTEFFFYAMFPLVFVRVLRRPIVWCAATVTGLVATWALFGLVWSVYGHGYALTGAEAHNDNTTNLISQFVMYFPPGRLPDFIFGILLFVFWSRGGRTHPLALMTVFVLLGSLLLAVQSVIPDVVLHNGLTAIVWAPLILAGASMRTGPLNLPPLVFLGRISFSLYLFHIPVALTVLALNKYWLGGLLSASPLLAAFGTTLLAIGIAAIVYATIEEPGRRFIVRYWREHHARAAVSPTSRSLKTSG
jgi:peptidoglycan/LPS O-acetylase OafA/YrhL